MTSNNWWPGTDVASDFVAPSRIIAGRGSSVGLAKVLAEQFGLTSGSVLVAADDIVLSAGLAKGLLDDLERANLSVVVVSGFGSEPSSTVIDEMAAKARAADAQVVIGIGGGSVLDSSKLLSLLMRNEGQTADWLGAVNPPNGVAPLLLIPTTCGTGSEATRIAMVTVDGAKRASSCARYIPSAVIIDPDLVATLPGKIVASTAMDALAHAIESLMSTSRSPMSAHHALRAIELLVGNIEPASRGEGDALAKCLWGSHLAGQALNAGVVVGHSLAYCLAYESPMAHGTSCALALPYCIAYNADLEPELARTLASAITEGRSDDLRVAAGELFALAKRLGLPTTLDEANVAPGAETSIASRVVSEYPRPTNPEPLVEESIARLLTAMRTGDLDLAFEAVSHAA